MERGFLRVASLSGTRLNVHWKSLGDYVSQLRKAFRRTVVKDRKAGANLSQRTMRLPRSVAVVLQERRDIQGQERLISGSRWNNCYDLVFTNRDGGPLDSSRVLKRFKEVFAASAQDNLHLHDLRHIAASYLLGAGISVADTAANLGHADPYLVVRTYGHAMPQWKRKAADAMENAFNRKVDMEED